MEDTNRKHKGLDGWLRKILHVMERIIAVVSLLGLGAALLLECY